LDAKLEFLEDYIEFPNWKTYLMKIQIQIPKMDNRGTPRSWARPWPED